MRNVKCKLVSDVNLLNFANCLSADRQAICNSCTRQEQIGNLLFTAPHGRAGEGPDSPIQWG
jgi:hypothetical protein